MLLRLVRSGRRLSGAGQSQDTAVAVSADSHSVARFAAQLAAEQESPKERIARFDRDLLHYDQLHRDLAAKHWRWGRRKLSELPVELQAQLIERWNQSSVPKRAEYFADFVRTELRRRLLSE